MNKMNGFTLLELMITLAITSILLTIGVPSLLSVARNSRTVTVTNELVTALHLARSEAIKRGVQVTLQKTGAEWEDGWKLIVDNDGDGVMDADDGDVEIGVFKAIYNGYTLRTGAHFNLWVAYRSNGRSRGNGGSNDTFRLCADDQDTENGRSIVINLIGRIRTSEGVKSCP